MMGYPIRAWYSNITHPCHVHGATTPLTNMSLLGNPVITCPYGGNG
ncbi:uncharacterized protein METZ01_LOCUS322800 [marine metagenome]|uniref:Uncharacterized protein n=1 Tax=marine metagenome TaxID=408172 RepID=A0A382P9K2_9ZZZZ